MGSKEMVLEGEKGKRDGEEECEKEKTFS